MGNLPVRSERQLDSVLRDKLPQLPKEQWPYHPDIRTPPTKSFRMGFEGISFSKTLRPGDCPACYGRGRHMVPKNPRTGSLRLVECEACEGSGKALRV